MRMPWRFFLFLLATAVFWLTVGHLDGAKAAIVMACIAFSVAIFTEPERG